MKLQKMLHKEDDLIESVEDLIITHIVDEIELGGEYTVCGRAIPDSSLDIEGWCAIGHAFKGSIKKCNCNQCIRVVRYFKSLR